MIKIILCLFIVLAAQGYGGELKRPLVSITFDDGWLSQYEEAAPLLKEYDYPATFYIFTQALGQKHYMTGKEVVDLKDQGHEIGSHSITHAHLNRLSSDKLVEELVKSKQVLEGLIGESPFNFAAPYGEADPHVISEIEKHYRSNRMVTKGLNSPDDLNLYKIRAFPVTSNTSLYEVEVWLDKVVKESLWMVFCYHGINQAPRIVDTSPEEFRKHLEAIRSRGITVLTVEEALKEIASQIGGKEG